MNNSLREQKLRDLARSLKSQGKSQSYIDFVLCELRQNSFAIGMNLILGTIIICNN